MKKALMALMLVAGLASARTIGQPDPYEYVPFCKACINAASYVMDKGDLWNTVWNRGENGDPNSIKGSYSWPGAAPGVNVYYQWQGKFWFGTDDPDTFVTQTEYGEWEWCPSPENTVGGFFFIGPGKSALDVAAIYHDFLDNGNNVNGRHLGVKVIERVLSWPHKPYGDLFGFECVITYDASQNDAGAPDPLKNVYVAWVYDADLCGADPTDPNIDDLVAFDGYTFGEWDNMSYNPSEQDSFCILSDTTLEGADGLPDGYIIWGDEDAEKEITKAWADAHNAGVMPDSTSYDRPDGSGTYYYYYLLPRNMSYIWDSENPADPNPDIGEGGACAGYIGKAAIYTTATPTDSTNPADPSFRITRAFAHQWWNWESDPPTDESRYQYLTGHHNATGGYRFAPMPYDLGAKEFDYRFVNSYGPFTIASGDTISIVWIGAVGMGLSGGNDNYWRGGEWMPGLRNLMDIGLIAYYTGSGYDPAHPSGPNESLHWQIPVPPVSPFLSYTANPDGIKLVWDKRAEITPDPVSGKLDFQGYAVYRSIYSPQFRDPPLAVFFKPGVPADIQDSIKDDIWPNTKDQITFYSDTTPHQFTDYASGLDGPKPGFPYYYAVTAFDWDEEKIISLESAKDNYLKSSDGAPLPTNMITQSSGDGWKDSVRVVPNPFLGSAVWTATEVVQKVEFQFLPPSCRIDIYTLSGDWVQTLEHRSGIDEGGVGSGTEPWDLLTRNGQRVVSGVYFYKVTVPDGDYMMGKMMVLR